MEQMNLSIGFKALEKSCSLFPYQDLACGYKRFGSAAMQKAYQNQGLYVYYICFNCIKSITHNNIKWRGIIRQQKSTEFVDG